MGGVRAHCYDRGATVKGDKHRFEAGLLSAGRWWSVASPALIAALGVFVVAGGALTLTHRPRRPPLAAKAAIRDALRDPQTAAMLKAVRWNRAEVSDVDGRIERVTLFAGPRIVAEFAVRPDGRVSDPVDFAARAVPYGDWVAYEPVVLAGLAVLFVLMGAVAPLRRVRNLDVVALLSLTAPVVLIQHRYLNDSVLAAVPAIVYLTARCAWRGLGPSPVATQRPSRPIFEVLTGRWSSRQRAVVLRWLLVVIALVFVMVGVSSTQAVDVIYAVMEGATKLLHGILPYGHLPGDVVHGDTYPILSYALYTPLAWLSPVNSVWDSVDLALGAAVLAMLGCAAVAHRLLAGRRAPNAGAGTAGPRAALLVLSFPPALAIVSTGTTDVMLGLLLCVAVLSWRRPGWSSGALAAAGWFKLAPFALLPLWLAPLRGRRLAAALGAITAVSAAVLALVFSLGGIGGTVAMFHDVSFQFTRGSLQSPWAALGAGGLQPWGQAAVLALIAGAAVALARNRDHAADPIRMAALTAAVMLALQLVGDYWAFLYLAWALPLVVVSLSAETVATIGRIAGQDRATVTAALAGVA